MKGWFMKESKKNNDVVSVHDVLSRYSNTFLSAEERQTLVNGAIKDAYRKSADPKVRELRDVLSQQARIKNFGEESAVELLGKLGIWLNAVDFGTTPESHTPQNECLL